MNQSTTYTPSSFSWKQKSFFYFRITRKKISNDQELTQSNPVSCLQNQKENK